MGLKKVNFVVTHSFQVIGCPEGRSPSASRVGDCRQTISSAGREVWGGQATPYRGTCGAPYRRGNAHPHTEAPQPLESRSFCALEGYLGVCASIHTTGVQSKDVTVPHRTPYHSRLPALVSASIPQVFVTLSLVRLLTV